MDKVQFIDSMKLFKIVSILQNLSDKNKIYHRSSISTGLTLEAQKWSKKMSMIIFLTLYPSSSFGSSPDLRLTDELESPFSFCRILKRLLKDDSWSSSFTSSVAEFKFSGLEIRLLIFSRFVLDRFSWSLVSPSSNEFPWLGFDILRWMLLRLMLGEVSWSTSCMASGLGFGPLRLNSLVTFGTVSWASISVRLALCLTTWRCSAVGRLTLAAVSRSLLSVVLLL